MEPNLQSIVQRILQAIAIETHNLFEDECRQVLEDVEFFLEGELDLLDVEEDE